MRVTRTIVYEGVDSWVSATLAKSYPDGVTVLTKDTKTGEPVNTITITTTARENE